MKNLNPDHVKNLKLFRAFGLKYVYLPFLAILGMCYASAGYANPFDPVYESVDDLNREIMLFYNVDTIEDWGANCCQGTIGDVYDYEYGGKLLYFQLKTSNYWYFPTSGVDNSYWRFLGEAKIFPVDTVVNTITANANNLENNLLADNTLYEQLMDNLRHIGGYASKTELSDTARNNAYDKLANLIKLYPQFLAEGTLDQSRTNRVIMVRSSLRQALYVLANITNIHPNHNPTTWKRLADDFQLTGANHRLLADTGVMLEDNHRLTEKHRELVRTYLRSRDADGWNVAMLRTKDLLKGGLDDVDHETIFDSVFGAPNTFSTDLGVPESAQVRDEFGPVEGSETSQFYIAMAHEINHQSLDQGAGRKTWRYQKYGNYYQQRKYEVLNRASGPYVLIQYNGGFQLQETQNRFRQAGLWDGNAATWDAAWKAYWDQDERRKNFPRDSLDWFLTAPQESFATLANIFDADGYRALEVAKVRHDRGLTENINAILLYIDYYSRDRGEMTFFTSNRDGDLGLKQVGVERNASGHVTGLDFRNGYRVDFQVDAGGWVTQNFTLPTYDQMKQGAIPGASFTLVNANSNKCVDVTDGSSANLADIRQNACSNSGAQMWEQVPGNGGFMLRNPQSGKCMGVEGGSTADGANVILYTCHGGANQLLAWQGSSLQFKHSGKCLNVRGASTADDASLEQWSCNGTGAQSFTKNGDPLPPPSNPIAGEIKGVASLPRVLCRNKISGQSIALKLGAADNGTWNCSVNGFEAVSGDKILNRITAQAGSAAISGSVLGFAGSKTILCKNKTTGALYKKRKVKSLEWDCSGLDYAAGDTIQVAIHGVAE